VPPEVRLALDGCDLLVLGTVAGFQPEGERVRAAAESHQPEAVALGVPPEDIETLDQLAGKPLPEDAAPDVQQAHLLRLLERFGTVRLPSADLEAAHAHARARGLPLLALDLDDATHAALFTERIGIRHIVAQNFTQKRLLKREFADARDAWDLCERFDRHLHRGAFRGLEQERERQMATELRKAGKGRARLLAVVPYPRMAGVIHLLQGS
jgi:pheromone shutdown protein TraB